MSIYQTAINKPVTTALIFVAVIIIGLFCFRQLPVDQFPEMDPPYVTVMTTYAGASASEMETNVTKVMENALNSVDHLKHITSTSKDNISMVTLEMEWGSDIDEAVNDIRSYVDMVRDNHRWCSSSRHRPCLSASTLSPPARPTQGWTNC